MHAVSRGASGCGQATSAATWPARPGPSGSRRLTGTTSDGEQVRVRGCDIFDLDDQGQVRRKDSYWKIVQP